MIIDPTFYGSRFSTGRLLAIEDYLYFRLLDRVVSGASFLTGGVFECDIAHRRSVAVLCMLYKIRYNPMHPLYGALPVPYVPVRVTRCAVIVHRFTYAPPRCRTSHYRLTFISLSVSLWNDLSDSMWDWRVSREGLMPFYWPICLLTFCLLLFSLYLLSFYGLVLWGWDLRTDRVLIALSQPCIANLFFNNNNNNNNAGVKYWCDEACFFWLILEQYNIRRQYHRTQG